MVYWKISLLLDVLLCSTADTFTCLYFDWPYGRLKIYGTSHKNAQRYYTMSNKIYLILIVRTNDPHDCLDEGYVSVERE